jgi:hypothetical protein
MLSNRDLNALDVIQGDHLGDEERPESNHSGTQGSEVDPAKGFAMRCVVFAVLREEKSGFTERERCRGTWEADLAFAFHLYARQPCDGASLDYLNLYLVNRILEIILGFLVGQISNRFQSFGLLSNAFMGSIHR